MKHRFLHGLGFWLIILLFLVLIGFLALRSARIQTLIAEGYLNRIEEEYGGTIDVGRILVRWPNRIELDQITIKGPLMDTLLYSSKARVSIYKANLRKSKIRLGYIRLDDLFLQIRELPSGELNLEVLLDLFAKNDSTPKRALDLSCNHLVLHNGKFRFKKFGVLPTPDRLNMNDILLERVELDARRIATDSLGFRGSLGLLGFSEQSGLKIERLAGDFVWKERTLSGRDVKLITQSSKIFSPEFELKNLVKNPNEEEHQLIVDATLTQGSKISPDEIVLITGYGSRILAPVEIAGSFRGTWNQATLRGARIAIDGVVSVQGDLRYDFPGNIRETYVKLDTCQLWVDMKGVKNQLLTGEIPGLNLVIPAEVLQLGKVGYTGKLEGTIDSFTNEGTWSFRMGNLSTQLSVARNDTLTGYLIKGMVSSKNFNPAKWMDKIPDISNLDFEIGLDAFWDGKKGYEAELHGFVHQIQYQSLKLSGLSLSGKADTSGFVGHLRLDDEKIYCDLVGQLDYRSDPPVYDFELQVDHADLAALQLDRKDSVSMLNLTLYGTFTGRNLDELDGVVRMMNTSYLNSRGLLTMDEFLLTAGTDNIDRKINIVSDYLDGRVVGKIHPDDLVQQIKELVRRFVPMKTAAQPLRRDHLNDFTFNLHLKDPANLTAVLFPHLQFKENSRISGSYRAADQRLFIEGASPQFVLAGNQYTNLLINIETRKDSMVVDGQLGKIQLDQNLVFERLNLDLVLMKDHLKAGLAWNNRSTPTSRGHLQADAQLRKDLAGERYIDLFFPRSEIIYHDSLWVIEPFQLTTSKGRVKVDGLALRHGVEEIMLHGALSRQAEDTLKASFHHVNLLHLKNFIPGMKTEIMGSLSGEARVFDVSKKGMFLADLAIEDLTINKEKLGLTTIRSRNDSLSRAVFMDVVSRRGAIETIKLNGSYHPENEGLFFDLTVDKLRLNLLTPFVEPHLQEIRGLASGSIHIDGSRSKPLMNGELLIQKGAFIVGYTNCRYTLTHTVKVYPDRFWVENLEASDEAGNIALVNGGVRHNNFSNIRLDFEFEMTGFKSLNTEVTSGERFYGQAYATGAATLAGPLRNLKIDVTARTGTGTRFAVPVAPRGTAREFDFITYVERPVEDREEDLLDFSVQKPRGYEADLSGVAVNLELEVTQDAEVKLIIDSKVGDVIRAKGNGDVRVNVKPEGGVDMFGDFVIQEGDYQFTLQNMPVKKFVIQPGGTIKWTGDVSNAQLDIDAVYNTKAALYDLLQDESSPELQQRIAVECHLLMTGMLENPSLAFSIDLPPNSPDFAVSQLDNLTEEDMNKQVISLLILGRFLPLQGLSTGSSRGYGNAGLATTTEVLSNQLNYWLSQISDDFDFGLNYRPGDQITSDEVEVALSQQLLNNRVSINLNGNYDVRSTGDKANQLVGDVEVEYKIRPSGKLRVKAFTRANDHLLYEYAPYTQGFGLFYREEFNSMGELFQRYFSRSKAK